MNHIEPTLNLNSVDFMREVREALSLRYWEHRDVLKKDMDEIRSQQPLVVREPNDISGYDFKASESDKP